MEAEEKINIADRQPDETEDAWNYYLLYRDLQHPRRKNALPSCGAGGKSYANVLKWSKEYKWDERIRIWDSELDAIRRAATKQAAAEQIKATTQRHAKNAQAFGAVVMNIQATVLKRIKESPNLLETMDFSKLLDTMMTAARILPALQQEERNALGIHPALNLILEKDVTKMTDEELQQFIHTTESLASTSAGKT